MSSNSAKEESATLKALKDKRTKFKRLIKHYVSEHTKIDGNDTLGHQRKLRAEQAIDPLTRCCSINKNNNSIETPSNELG
jgi:hypothetical protein